MLTLVLLAFAAALRVVSPRAAARIVGQPQEAAESSHATRKPHLDHEALPAPRGGGARLQRVDASHKNHHLEL